MNDQRLSVVIAGGGFCGVMTLVNLLKIADRPLHITLINKGSAVARGIAYSTYSDLHLLNVRAANMSAFPDIANHFTEWCLKQNNIQINKDELGTSFLPRNVYGKYLEEILDEAIRNAPSFCEINILNDEATGTARENENLAVLTASGKRIIADKFVLATGNCPPDTPSFGKPDFINSGNYFANPWSENAVVGLDDSQTALIVGTGLTMVDVVIGLREKNFNGKIVALSPHGFNILAHRESKPQRYILDELSPPYNLENLFRLFYKHIRLAKKQGESGETVVDAIRAKTQEIWQQLSLNDKKKFMSHLRHLWGVARHRLPGSIHTQMRKMIREKKLEVIAGRIRSIKEFSAGLQVTIQKRNQSELIIDAGRIINCTGPQTDIRKQNSLFFDDLLKKGLIRPDEMNLGVDATPEGKIIDANNNISGNIFALGSLLKGKLWESTAIPELRVQAKRVAELILK